ncbi:MAG: glycosyltransferase family 2 protein [Candidatus Acidulodesulfobacterium ferriphilum]|uniref:Glycosyltransferase family 2 protein n=1 Tax=Candidatus Acidulodesulfobacterium ferriphilum TaxID=2597223 RepID=A0A519BAE9_9DELT|nr:MAG: glycosyltransferase family 2 protein [Candidatus Acidulodesulfobacterium ferriphilum]
MKIYPKINILIPTYNRANYLINAIEGALSQDYENLEVIVLDDASSDNTQEVAQNYLKDKRFKLYKNTENLGGFRSFKKLVYEYNNSDWFLFQSDDDYLTDNKYISKCVSLLNKYKEKNVVLIGSNQDHVFEDNRNIKINTCRFFYEINDGRSIFLDFYKASFPGAFSLQKTDVIKKLKCWTFEGFSSDSEAILMLCLNGYVGFLNETSGCFRFYNTSKASYMSYLNLPCHEALKIAMNNIQFIKNLYNYAKTEQIFPNKILENWREKMIIWYSRSTFFNFLHNSNSESAMLFKKEIIKKYPFVSLHKVSIISISYYLTTKNFFIRKIGYLYKYKMLNIMRLIFKKGYSGDMIK